MDNPSAERLATVAIEPAVLWILRTAAAKWLADNQHNREASAVRGAIGMAGAVIDQWRKGGDDR